MTLRFDPFRDFDRLASQVLGAARTPDLMPMDCYRQGDQYVLHFDLPGIDPESLEVTTENNTLTVRAERRRVDSEDISYLVSERAAGTYARQLVLGEGMNTDRIHADYRDGVLTVTIPVAEEAKPRQIQISRGGQHKVITGEVTDSSSTNSREATEIR
ncbi:MAG TPA: Hsp20/alpha crystallin family protein [Micromonosporaceae bacterium]